MKSRSWCHQKAPRTCGEKHRAQWPRKRAPGASSEPAERDARGRVSLASRPAWDFSAAAEACWSFFFLRGAPQNAARKPHAENAYRSKAAPPALVKHFFQNCQKMAAFYKQPPKWRVGFMHEVYSIIKRELVFRKSQAGESFKTLESMANIRFYYIVIGSAQVCATSFIWDVTPHASI